MKNALFSLLLLVALFFLVEGVLRFFVFESSAVGIWGFNPYGQGDLRGGVDSVVLIKPELPYRLVTDDEGFRTCGREGTETSLRVLAVGDSFTFGPYVENESTYPCLLQETLNAVDSDHRFEVLNAGIPGYTVTDERHYLLEKGLELKPQVVLLGIYTNDIVDLAPSARAKFARPGHQDRLQGARFYMRRLAWYDLAVRIRYAALSRGTPAKVRPPPTPPDREKARALTPSVGEWQPYWPEYQSGLRGLVSDLRQRQIPLLVILFPHVAQVEGRSSEEIQEAIREVLLEEGVPFIDLLPHFQEEPGGLYLLPINHHLSARGNRLAADLIREALVRHALIPAPVNR